jgi:flagellar protein FliL
MASTTANQQPIVPAKSGKLKLILIVVIGALLLLGAGAGGAYFLFGKGGASSPAKPAPIPPPVFFPLESMTVNLQSDDGMHYLRVGLTLKLADEKTQAALNERMPEIRSRVLLLLSNKHPDQISTLEGKRTLAGELRTAVEMTAGSTEKPVHVDDVLFTEFVIQ